MRWERDRWPVFSPDGKRIAFYRNLGWERGDIYLMTLDGGEIEQLTFDDKDIVGLTWTSDNQEIIFSSNRGGDLRLWRIATSGGIPELLSTGLYAHNPTISTDGQSLAFSELKIEKNIWRMQMPASPDQKVIPEKIITSSRMDDFFQLSPDGKKIAFESTRSGNYQIWVCNSDGQNQAQLTYLKDGAVGPYWSPDGRWITFSSKQDYNYDIFIISSNGGTPKRITNHVSHDMFPYWSKDGNWLYFSSDRSGIHQIWKISLKGGTAIQITRDGARSGFESADRKWLYYHHHEDRKTIRKIPVTGGEMSIVLDENIGAFDWTLVEDGIFYTKHHSKILNFKLFDFASQSIQTITTLEIESRSFFPQISPDQKWIYLTLEEPWQADIKLVENWR
jgi:Tol biopolymer transport system component